MHINLSYAASTAGAPTSFFEQMQAAASMIEEAFTDDITINIEVDWGIGPRADPNMVKTDCAAIPVSDTISYADLRADLDAVSRTPADATALDHLPSGDSIDGYGTFSVARAQEKAFGLIAANDAGIDGYVGMGTNWTGEALFAAALHEITHAMGRSLGTAFDLFRFTSPGQRLYSSDDTAPAAYFSIDNGVTHLANYGQTSDPSDLLNNDTLTDGDPFEESASGREVLTKQDLEQMDVLGFTPNKDFIAGDHLDNVLVATPTGSVLYGNLGDDTLIGGDASDRLEGGGGADVLIGGAGLDVASYVHSRSQVWVNLATGLGRYGDAAGDRLYGILNLEGSAYDDRLTGDANSNWLLGGDGKDLLDGAGGVDLLVGGKGDDTYRVDDPADVVSEPDTMLDGGNDTVIVVAAINYKLAAHEKVEILRTLSAANTLAINLTGNEFANTLQGNAAGNKLDGGGGADFMFGFGGDDTYYVDDPGDVVVELAGQGHDTVLASGVTSYRMTANVEDLNILGAAIGSVTAVGNAENNKITVSEIPVPFPLNPAVLLPQTTFNLFGGDGDDTIVGGNAMFTFTAAGITTLGDTLDGGIGNDGLSGLLGDDTLRGGAGDDALDGGAGVDKMFGGTGDDTYFVDALADLVVEAAGEGRDTVKLMGVTGYRLTANVEDMYVYANTGQSRETAFGNGENNVITAVDATTGGLGSTAFALYGGDGDDIIYGGNANSVGVTYDILDGGIGNDRLYGRWGNDLLLGGPGADMLDGGDDSLNSTRDVASYSNATTGVTLNLATGINTGDAAGDTFYSIEVFVGSPFDDTMTGDASANELHGGAGRDTLDGGGGADMLFGDGGDDTIIADNLDTVRGGVGRDTVIAASSTVAAGFKFKLIGTGVEEVDGAGGDDAINATGVAYAVTLNGGDGDDTLTGGLGADTLDGGNGNDIFLADNLDRVLGGAGYDYVRAAPSTAATGFRFNVAGTNVECVDGSSGADVIDMTGATNTSVFEFYGHGGDDRLITGSEPAWFYGGDGNDTMIFSGNLADYTITPVNTDYAGWTKIANTATGVEHWAIGVENLQFADQTIPDPTAASYKRGNFLANTLTGGAGDDVLDGRGGPDKLYAGAGNDALFVDNNTAVIDGGPGYDVAYANETASVNGLNISLAGKNIECVYSGMAADVVDLTGVAANNQFWYTIHSGAGDDLVIADAAQVQVEGGPGQDTLQLTGNHTDYAFTTLPSDFESNQTNVTNKITGAIDYLFSVETLKFADGVFATNSLV